MLAPRPSHSPRVRVHQMLDAALFPVCIQGEPQGPEGPPYGWPDINSHFGVLDIAGFPKDRFFWYAAWLRKYSHDDGIIHLLPQHWNWQKGQLIDVWVFSNAAAVELHVDGVPVGRRNQTRYGHVEWPAVPFSGRDPGSIRAVGFNSAGAVIAEQAIETTGQPVRLRASIKDGVGAYGIVAGCNDVALVQVEVLDLRGRVVIGPLQGGAVVNVTFTVHGHGAAYVGGGNGDPSCHVNDLSPRRPAYHGRVLGLIQSTNLPDAGTTAANSVVEVRTSAPGLEGSSVHIRIIHPVANRSIPWWCKREPQI